MLVRVDLNVPMDGAKVTDDTRLRAMLPTVLELSDRGAIVLLLSHFGRPKGEVRPDMSTAQLVLPLHRLTGRSVRFIEDCQGPEAERAITTMLPGNIGVLENTRFHLGEEKNDPELAKAMAALGDFYVDDAFSTAHRAHASTEGITHFLPSFAGRAMEAELKALEQRARQSRAAGRGGGRRRQGLDQARRARPSRRQGRSSDHRRRHGQHLPRRARRQCRQVAVRA